MPGRKSNLSTVTNGDEESPAPAARAAREGSSVEDLALPRTMISRLAKGVLPPNTSIHKDALLALSKSCTVFVNFLASNSNEYAQLGGKKTIQPADVIAALKENEFEHFIPRLEAELKKYNTVQCDKRNSYRRKIREEKASKLGEDGKPTDSGAENGDADASMLDATEMSAVNGHSRNDGEEPPSKKLRREAGEDEDEEGEDEEFHDALEGEDDEVVEGEGEEEADEEGDEEDDDEEEQVEDGVDDEEGRVGDGMRDEALDDASEDSD
ncbi:hypothetical protein QM012_006919 [Aureobasidium pullulans]|uniref:DNA polymerase epsilon subunit D n=1 Tax=Aureobasidium pullulans TaxID=5580 RepID=A0ABR0TPX3_AURPU